MEVKAQVVMKHHIEQVLGSITTAGYETLYAFVDELLNVHNQWLSSRVSKMLDWQGKAILNSIQSRQPDIVK